VAQQILPELVPGPELVRPVQDQWALVLVRARLA